MFIEGDQDASFNNHPLHDCGIVSAGLACFRSTQDVMPFVPQHGGKFSPHHLIEVEPHALPRDRLGDLCVFDGCGRIVQRRTNIDIGKLRVSSKY